MSMNMTRMVFFLLAISTYAVLAAVPDPPRGVETEVVTPTSVKLTWMAPVNNGGFPITKYKVTVAEDSLMKENAHVLCDQDTTRVLAPGLVEGRKYYFEIRAYNSDGWSNPLTTNETPSTTAAAPVVVPGAPPLIKTPRAPLSFTAIADSPTTIVTKWMAPTSVEGVALPDKYALDMAYDEKFTVGVTRVFESDSLSFRVSGLAPETDYWLRLSPHNAAGYGEAVVAKVRTESVSATGPGGQAGGSAARDESCPNDCSGNGICFKATRTCTCLPGYEGVACNHASRRGATEQSPVDPLRDAAGDRAVIAEKTRAKPADKPYCAELCGDSCSPACRKYCKVTCPSLNSAPYAICQSKCEVCSADCTKICPEACPNLAPPPPSTPVAGQGSTASSASAGAAPAAVTGEVSASASKVSQEGSTSASKESTPNEHTPEAKVSVHKEAITALADSTRVEDRDRVLECVRRGADGVCVKFQWNVSPAKQKKSEVDGKNDADDEWDLNDEEIM